MSCSRRPGLRCWGSETTVTLLPIGGRAAGIMRAEVPVAPSGLRHSARQSGRPLTLIEVRVWPVISAVALGKREEPVAWDRGCGGEGDVAGLEAVGDVVVVAIGPAAGAAMPFGQCHDDGLARRPFGLQMRSPFTRACGEGDAMAAKASARSALQPKRPKKSRRKDFGRGIAISRARTDREAQAPYEGERRRFRCNAAKSGLPFVSDLCFQAQECCAEVSRWH